MNRKDKYEFPPLDPEIKDAWLRILEKSFGEFGAKGSGTPSELAETVDREIAKEYTDIKDSPEKILNKRRVMLARFFEIVANEPKTPSGNKYDQITEKFMADSIEKYQSENHDADS
jgi:hypothetical protein